MSFKVPEQYRQPHPSGLPHGHGDLFGFFVIPANIGAKRPYTLRCIASAGDGEITWEHVSVSTALRCPTWDEMCMVKSLFWDREDVVVQYHPRESEYVNLHEFCLHLWRPLHVTLPEPPMIAVGPR